MKLIHNISANIEEESKSVISRVRKKYGLSPSVPVFVFRKSIDARRKNDIKFIYSFCIDTEKYISESVEYNEYDFKPKKINNSAVPYVIGMGPAGLFCAYTLALYGLKPVLVERGKEVERRVNDIENFWNGGNINTESNVQFGEGGAGTFSDGKLVTRISDPRCRRVLELFVRFGASPDILVNAKPHIGTDVLRKVVVNMRNEIIRLGGKVLFETKLTDMDTDNGSLKAIYLNGNRIDCNLCILAIGNGACDTYRMLLNKNLNIIPKPFSVGFRMEHKQSDINNAMYGQYADVLPPADYSFSHVFDKKTSSAVYTFCMCPGGYVINSSSDTDGIVTNGMSYKGRNGNNANSAMLASVSFNSAEAGLNFRRNIEETAYNTASGLAPVSTIKNYIDDSVSTEFNGVIPTFQPGTEFCNLNNLFPKQVNDMLKVGLNYFSKRIFNDEFAVLTGVETRTSSPLRILRNNTTFEALGCQGLYPCGEGAGYSGGITSSAVDGIKTAEFIIER